MKADMRCHIGLRLCLRQQRIFAPQFHAVGPQDEQAGVIIAKACRIAIMACLNPRRLINVAAFKVDFSHALAQLTARQNGGRIGVI